MKRKELPELVRKSRGMYFDQEMLKNLIQPSKKIYRCHRE